jgi:hypothetical protein
MAYCSIQEAFPDPEQSESGRIARKEERRRAKQCKGPALAFLKAGGDLEVDVDRQQYTRTGDGEWVGGGGAASAASVKEGFTGSEDVIGSEGSIVPKKAGTTRSLPALAAETPGYFGKGMEEGSGFRSSERATGVAPKGVEGYADFRNEPNDNPGYVLNSDFLASFGAVGYEKSAGKPILSKPSVNDAWKPMGPTGATTSFFEALPWTGSSGERSRSDGLCSMSVDEKEQLVKRIDILFAKLERLESARNENATSEISLFVLSGLFLMFGLDVIRRTA